MFKSDFPTYAKLTYCRMQMDADAKGGYGILTGKSGGTPMLTTMTHAHSMRACREVFVKG
jgi:hypothetical protein